MPFPALQQSLWLHAVSVGEAQAALPLIEALRASYPRQETVVTTTTPTGSDLVLKRFGSSIKHCYFPYDLPFCMRSFLDTVDPRAALFMETEIWPNCFSICSRKGIPIVMINARLSLRSYRGYRRIKFFIAPVLQNCRAILAQSQADAERFLDLGVNQDKVHVTGNLKFDQRIPPDTLDKGEQLRSLFGSQRPVWVAASTHSGEEEYLLQAHSQVCDAFPNALLILVPRHPERFEEVARLCSRKGYSLARRSQGQEAGNSAIYLGDTMGELLTLYAASDLAFVGGSLVSVGGHNMLEPAALSKPILAGPQLHNFQEIADMLKSNKAMFQVIGSHDLARHVIQLFKDDQERQAIGQRGCKAVEQNRGALEKNLQHIERVLNPKNAAF